MDNFQKKVEIKKLLEAVKKVCEHHNVSCTWELLNIRKKLEAAMNAQDKPR